MGYREQMLTLCVLSPCVKLWRDTARNDKTYDVTSSHEIKAMHSGALCEKYGNVIVPGKQTIVTSLTTNPFKLQYKVSVKQTCVGIGEAV